MNGDYTLVIAEASAMLAQAVLSQEKNLRNRARTVDSDVKELLRKAGLATMSEILGTLSEEVTAETEARGLKVNRRGSISFCVLFGQVDVESPYHWDRENKDSARPVFTELGLKHRGRSIGVERALSDFGNEESFGQAAKRFEEHYGWKVGRTTILRVVENRARESESYVKDRLQQCETNFLEPLATRPGVDSLLVELDGCEIRTGTLEPVGNRKRTEVYKRPCRKRITAWRDVRVALAGPLDTPDSRTYVARMKSYPDVVRQLFQAACDQNMSTNTDVTAVGDGGNGLREEICSQFPGTQYILDRAHLKSHVYQTADKQGLKGADRELWVRDLMAQIDEGHVQTVLSALKSHKGRGKKRVARLIKYLTRFSDAVHYAAFRKKGLPIGSGEIESCHRWLPQKRLKLPGAWWKPETVNPMLALRVLRANDWWDDFWSEQADLAAA